MFAAALSQAKALLSHNERKNPDLLQEVALALLEQANAGKELMPDEAVRMARNRETSFYLKSNKIFDPEAEVNIDPDLIPPTIRRCCGFTEYSEFSESLKIAHRRKKKSSTCCEKPATDAQRHTRCLKRLQARATK
jgi:hypothetical protein